MSDPLETALGVYDDAACPDHPIKLDRERIVEAIAARQWCSCEEYGKENCGTYCDTAGAAVVKLDGGTYAVIWEESDDTGHG